MKTPNSRPFPLFVWGFTLGLMAGIALAFGMGMRFPLPGLIG